MCLIPEGRGIFPNLTVRENVLMDTFSRQRSRSTGDLEEVAYGRFPRLGERRHQLAGTLSGGEQQMLALARALTTDPAVILLDELSMGLAPTIVAELFDVVRDLAAGGITTVVVEQFAGVIAFVDQVAVMTQGRIRAVGPPDEVERPAGLRLPRGHRMRPPRRRTVARLRRRCCCSSAACRRRRRSRRTAGDELRRLRRRRQRARPSPLSPAHPRAAARSRCPLEATISLATATLSSGGQGFGRASTFFPGTLTAGLRPLHRDRHRPRLPLPDYPIVVESREFEPAKHNDQPGITMSTDVDPDRAIAIADTGGIGVPPGASACTRRAR